MQHPAEPREPDTSGWEGSSGTRRGPAGATGEGGRIVRRLALLVVLVAATSGLGALTATAPAGASGDAEARFAALASGARGGAPHRVAPDLVEVARRHSARMAARDHLHHNPNLTSEVQSWSAVAENVGVGFDVDSIHRAFMDSPSHRANIVDGRYTEIGVGVVQGADGRLWVTQVFRQPTSAPPPTTAPPTTAAPAPSPTTAPAPPTTTTTAPVPPPPAPEVTVERESAPTTSTTAPAAKSRRTASTEVAVVSLDLRPVSQPDTTASRAPLALLAVVCITLVTSGLCARRLGRI